MGSIVINALSQKRLIADSFTIVAAGKVKFVRQKMSPTQFRHRHFLFWNVSNMGVIFLVSSHFQRGRAGREGSGRFVADAFLKLPEINYFLPSLWNETKRARGLKKARRQMAGLIFAP